MTPQQRNDTVNHVVWRPLGIPLGNPQEHFAGTHNDLAVAALVTATTAVAAANLMSPQQRTKDTEESLMSLTLPQLKQRCAALGTPVTGNKPKLISMILDPATNQKKKAKAPGSGIKKQRTKATKLFRAGEKCKECGDEARPPGYTRRSISHRHAPSASAQAAPKSSPRGWACQCSQCPCRETQAGEGERKYGGLCAECSGYEHCEGCDECFPEDEINPMSSLCPSCQYDEDDLAIGHGVCPGCMKRNPPCEMDEMGEYECCM